MICPACGSDLEVADSSVKCEGCQKSFALIDGDIASLIGHLNEDAEFSRAKWDERYLDYAAALEAERDYKRWYLDDTKRQVMKFAPSLSNRSGIYLEIGCGLGFLGEELAREGWFFIGIDFSINSLRMLKQRLTDRGIDNYFLVHGDILSLPIRDDSLDLVYGGGVIEHFKNTRCVLAHIFRALKTGGVSFNTVPYFNIGNLLYRSCWGGIPNIPVLRQLSEFVHLKLLGGKHMIFGYELQFTRVQLRTLHSEVGFRIPNVLVDRFDCQIQLEKLDDGFLKTFFKNLCRNHRQFWPMVKVVGVK